MGTFADRRHVKEVPFRPAGTHFRFKNGWIVSMLANEPISADLYEVHIYDPLYHALKFGKEGVALHKVGPDALAKVLALVQTFDGENEKAPELITALVAPTL
jgi:hypothetical protein